MLVLFCQFPEKKHFVEFPERHSCQMSTVLDMEDLGWSEWSMIIELINRWEAVLIHTRKLIREIEHMHWNKHSLSTALWKSVSPLPIALLCFGFCIFVKNLFDHQTNFNIRKLFMNASIFYHLSGFGSQAWAEMPRISVYRYIEIYSLYIKMYNFFLIKSVPGYEKWSL